jgi:hypothetical protein
MHPSLLLGAAASGGHAIEVAGRTYSHGEDDCVAFNFLLTFTAQSSLISLSDFV